MVFNNQAINQENTRDFFSELKKFEQPNPPKGPLAWARELGLRSQLPDESAGNYRAFIEAAVEQHQRGTS